MNEAKDDDVYGDGGAAGNTETISISDENKFGCCAEGAAGTPGQEQVA